MRVEARIEDARFRGKWPFEACPPDRGGSARPHHTWPGAGGRDIVRSSRLCHRLAEVAAAASRSICDVLRAGTRPAPHSGRVVVRGAGRCAHRATRVPAARFGLWPATRGHRRRDSVHSTDALDGIRRRASHRPGTTQHPLRAPRRRRLGSATYWNRRCPRSARLAPQSRSRAGDASRQGSTRHGVGAPHRLVLLPARNSRDRPPRDPQQWWPPVGRRPLARHPRPVVRGGPT